MRLISDGGFQVDATNFQTEITPLTGEGTAVPLLSTGIACPNSFVIQIKKERVFWMKGVLDLQWQLNTQFMHEEFALGTVVGRTPES